MPWLGTKFTKTTHVIHKLFIQGVGNPQAEVDEWILVEGEVTAMDSTQISLTLTDGQAVEIYGRPWTYAQENGRPLWAGRGKRG